MSENTGAAWRILLSLGVIVGVLAAAIAVAKVIQAHTEGDAAAEAGEAGARAPEDAPAEIEDASREREPEDAGLDAARVEAMCDAIAKEIEATASRKLGNDMGDASTWLLPDLFRDAHCVGTRSGGIWAMVPTGVRLKGDASPEHEVLWEVVHVSAKGERATLAQPPFVSSVERSLDLEQPTAFDFDGDGEDEAILTGASWVRDGASAPYARMWTLKGKKIEPYARAPEFASTDDIDDDGRPDLLTNGPYVAVPSSDSPEACGASEQRVTGPLLALHARPDGTFSAVDEQALTYAKRACPGRPKNILIKQTGNSQRGSADNLACARMWGVSETDITAMVTKECHALHVDVTRPEPPHLDAGRPDGATPDAGKTNCSGDVVCDDWARFRPWLHAKPPVSLK